ncbi:GNAT family N-acetyltransferase [Leptolyngbya sp. AN03gr2]|uniref:GNAT family N-acetyltransferase n=1 Tax=unclassified Leptolyngbya TaxID=2650499 RepID=UPI003D323101
MQLTFQRLGKEHALAILNWCYAPPYDYDYYNFNPETAQEELEYLLDPKQSFYAIVNSEGELEGYCSFGSDGRVPGGDYTAEALDIGMGLKPDLTGQGHGRLYAQAIVNYGGSQYKVHQLRVTIAAFNKRAQRVWEQLGFKQVEKFFKVDTREEFVIMVHVVC